MRVSVKCLSTQKNVPSSDLVLLVFEEEHTVSTERMTSFKYIFYIGILTKFNVLQDDGITRSTQK